MTRIDEIRARLDAASTATTMDVHAGRSTLRASVTGGNRGRFINGMGDLVAATVGETGPFTVTVADDEDGQDATLALHARDDLAFLLGKVDSLLAHNGVLVTEIRFQATRADEQKALAKQLQGRLDTAEGQLAKARARHRPKTVLGGIVICENCLKSESSIYGKTFEPWPCPEASDLGLGEGDGQ